MKVHSYETRGRGACAGMSRCTSPHAAPSSPTRWPVAMNTPLLGLGAGEEGAREQRQQQQGRRPQEQRKAWRWRRRQRQQWSKPKAGRQHILYPKRLCGGGREKRAQRPWETARGGGSCGGLGAGGRERAGGFEVDIQGGEDKNRQHVYFLLFLALWSLLVVFVFGSLTRPLSQQSVFFVCGL